MSQNKSEKRFISLMGVFLSRATRPPGTSETRRFYFVSQAEYSNRYHRGEDNNHSVGSGLQQALGYAKILDIPVAFSSNGDGFVQHDLSGLTPAIEKELSLDAFPSPDELWQMYKKHKKITTPEQEEVASFDYFLMVQGARLDTISR